MILTNNQFSWQFLKDLGSSRKLIMALKSITLLKSILKKQAMEFKMILLCLNTDFIGWGWANRILEFSVIFEK
jgi:hypothetical protein